MTVPTGNGEARGIEAAGDAGEPLPGTRPERAAANCARNSGNGLPSTPADQGGFGTEDMESDVDLLGIPNVRWHDAHAQPVHLAAMGDAGQTFGGA